MTKVCHSCKEEKSLEAFYDRPNSKDGKHYYCKPCAKSVSKESLSKSFLKNPEKFRESQRNSQLKYQFGLTTKTYNTILESQGNCCAICKVSENVTMKKSGVTKSFAVDHDHETGAIRGLLCDNCNRGIGLLKDSIDILVKATDYLKKHKQEN